jgi:hypothetical protein
MIVYSCKIIFKHDKIYKNGERKKMSKSDKNQIYIINYSIILFFLLYIRHIYQLIHIFTYKFINQNQN